MSTVYARKRERELYEERETCRGAMMMEDERCEKDWL